MDGADGVKIVWHIAGQKICGGAADEFPVKIIADADDVVAFGMCLLGEGERADAKPMSAEAGEVGLFHRCVRARGDTVIVRVPFPKTTK